MNYQNKIVPVKYNGIVYVKGIELIKTFDFRPKVFQAKLNEMIKTALQEEIWLPDGKLVLISLPLVKKLLDDLVTAKNQMESTQIAYFVRRLNAAQAIPFVPKKDRIRLRYQNIDVVTASTFCATLNMHFAVLSFWADSIIKEAGMISEEDFFYTERQNVNAVDITNMAQTAALTFVGKKYFFTVKGCIKLAAFFSEQGYSEKKVGIGMSTLLQRYFFFHDMTPIQAINKVNAFRKIRFTGYKTDEQKMLARKAEKTKTVKGDFEKIQSFAWKHFSVEGLSQMVGNSKTVILDLLEKKSWVVFQDGGYYPTQEGILHGYLVFNPTYESEMFKITHKGAFEMAETVKQLNAMREYQQMERGA